MNGAIITGRSRGIGRASAVALANDGYAVVINYAGFTSGAEQAVADSRR